MTARSYGGKTDAALELLAASPLKLTARDFAALAVALCDQAGMPPREQASVAILLDLAYEDGEVLACWACGEPGAIVRAEAAPGEQIACERCDEDEREAAARRSVRERHERTAEDREHAERQPIARIA